MSDFNIDFSKLGPLENGDIVPTGSDKEFSASFHMERVPNFEGSDFAEVAHLRLQAPGNTKTVFYQPVRLDSHPDRPSDPERFPREWAAFQAGTSDEDGTNLYAWPDVVPADARRMELLGIKTVEQLARVSDANLEGLGMGGRLIRDRARAFISGAGSNEAELRDQVTKLTDIVNALMEQKTAPPKAPTPQKEKANA